MSAYMIVFAKIHDRDRFISEYGAPNSELIKQFGGEYLFRGPGVETIEGDMFDGTSSVISKWPSREAIKAYWNSEAYAALKAKRQGLADVNVSIVGE